MSRKEQSIGKHGQELAASALRRVGVLMVEQIATPVIVSRVSGKPVVVAWGEQVSGDHRGILPGGRSVLAETKTIRDHALRWSDFREHQPGRLDAHAEAGGLSLVVWVNEDGAYVMRWPIPGFGPQKSIDLETARELAISEVPA
jgi:hypothetical protein